jgi:hypothetical protein
MYTKYRVFGGMRLLGDLMPRKKNDTNPQEQSDKEQIPKMLSMEELKIISDMVMTSLKEDLSKIMNANDPFTSDEALYEETSDEPSEIFSFPAHKVQDRFYAVNNPSECPMCGSKINKFGHYNLEFGSNIRKKASFCGIDCLQQFINELSYSKGF